MSKLDDVNKKKIDSTSHSSDINSVNTGERRTVADNGGATSGGTQRAARKEAKQSGFVTGNVENENTANKTLKKNTETPKQAEAQKNNPETQSSHSTGGATSGGTQRAARKEAKQSGFVTGNVENENTANKKLKKNTETPKQAEAQKNNPETQVNHSTEGDAFGGTQRAVRREAKQSEIGNVENRNAANKESEKNPEKPKQAEAQKNNPETQVNPSTEGDASGVNKQKTEITGEKTETNKTEVDNTGLKELNEEKIKYIKENNKEYYDNARELARNSEMGMAFTDHGPDHVEQVREKSVDVANALEAAIKDGAFESINEKNKDNEDYIPFAGGVDRAVLEGAALSHDTGMCGDGYALPYYKEQGNKIFIKENNGYKVERVNNSNFSEVRDNHSLNSAINILKDRKKFELNGYSPEQIDMMAALCMAHSKSCSGVMNLNSKEQWKESFKKINDVVKQYNEDVEQYNEDHKDQKDKIQFNGDNFLNNKEEMGKLVTSALALRVGDVSRDSHENAISQSGVQVEVKENAEKNTECKEWQQEIKNFIVTIDGKEILNEKSKQVHIGEQNIVKNDTFYDKGSVTHEISVNDGGRGPLCTQEAIMDHMNEFNTARDAKFNFVIKFPNDKTYGEFQKSYDKFRTSMLNKYPNFTITYPWDNKEK